METSFARTARSRIETKRWESGVPGLKPNGENNLAFQDWNQTVRIWRIHWLVIPVAASLHIRIENGAMWQRVAPLWLWQALSLLLVAFPVLVYYAKSVSRVEQQWMHAGTRTYCSPSWDIVAFLRKKDSEASSGGCVLVKFTTLPGRHRRRNYNKQSSLSLFAFEETLYLSSLFANHSDFS
jgi:hypothetical protein